MFAVMVLVFGVVVLCVRVSAVLVWWCGGVVSALFLVAFVALVPYPCKIVHV